MIKEYPKKSLWVHTQPLGFRFYEGGLQGFGEQKKDDSKDLGHRRTWTLGFWGIEQGRLQEFFVLGRTLWVWGNEEARLKGIGAPKKEESRCLWKRRRWILQL